MKLNTRKYKGNTIKRTLYLLENSCNLDFEELQKDGSIDAIHSIIKLNSNQQAYYSHEYIPEIIDKTAKNVDVTVILDDQTNKKMIYHAIDSKRGLLVLNNEKATDNISSTYANINHFIEQIKASHTYFSMLCHIFTAYQFEFNPVLAIRWLNLKDLIELINVRKKEILAENKETLPPLLQLKADKQKLNETKKIEILEDFSNKIITINSNTTLSLEIIYANKVNNKYIVEKEFSL